VLSFQPIAKHHASQASLTAAVFERQDDIGQYLSDMKPPSWPPIIFPHMYTETSIGFIHARLQTRWN